MAVPLYGLIHRIATDPESFLNCNWHKETELPLSPEHPGSFLYKRRHHVHEGIDLYCLPGQLVVAMTPGIVTNIIPFTGEIAGTPHWHNTYGVVVEDTDGVWIYGEISPADNLLIGSKINEGQLVGIVTPVLKTNKGRPTSMLHLERYTKGTTHSIGILEHNNPIPDNLVDPVPELLRICNAASSI